jgi:NADPH-dependent glutamate synthase beta subunit-like oxidoreductase/Pyruvate/2-oxoacid:ferredoxin oxidoreductase delta subunit
MPELTHVDRYPEIPVSLIPSRGVLQTGDWRNLRPVLHQRPSPCTAACPALVPIPRYLHLISEGRIEEAYAEFTLRNPFPAITGRVCPHDCETACSRTGRDGAVSIRVLERHLGDRAGDLPHPIPDERSGHYVAVVGSGPAGLSAAYYLRREGHAVTVYERRDRAGGVLRYGIPDYRLPSDVVEREIERLADMGIGFSMGVSLGEDVTLEDLAVDHDAVFVATGAWQERPMGIPGEDLLIPGLAYLDAVNRGEAALPGSRCAVVGGGNTAMDVARVLRRLGADVAVLYRRTAAEMPAIAEEVERAAADGVRFEFLSQPVAAEPAAGRVALTVERMRLGEPDSSRRRRPEPTGETSDAVFDAVVTAIGETAEVEPFPAALIGPDGWLTVGPHGETGDDRIFVGGDLTTGPATVVEAIGAGRRAAAAIHARLDEGATPEWATPLPGEPVDAGETNPAYFPRRLRLDDPPSASAAPLAEETATVSPVAALAEIERCYSCGYCNECGTCFVFCPDSAITWNGGPVFDYEVCKGCGVCTAECPGHVLVEVKEQQ